VDIIVADNRYHPKVALRNADLLIRENVDLVIEFQTNDSVAPAIAAKYREAHIPLIAIDIPHPQATYFGANNFEAGLLAGHYLARYAQRWNGRVDEVLLLEIGRAGSLPAARSRLSWTSRANELSWPCAP
jgi:ribose transport system substrate-binding protein